MPRDFSLENTRNIGIMAHIDAGKRQLRSVSFTTQAESIKLVKPMRVEAQWTGWS